MTNDSREGALVPVAVRRTLHEEAFHISSSVEVGLIRGGISAAILDGCIYDVFANVLGAFLEATDGIPHRYQPSAPKQARVSVHTGGRDAISL